MRESEKENVKAPSAPEALHSAQWFQCLCLSLVNPSHPVILNPCYKETLTHMLTHFQ